MGGSEKPNHQTTFPQDWRRKLGPDLGALGVALVGEKSWVFFVKRGEKPEGGVWHWVFPTNRGKTTKMDGENDGKPNFLKDDLGGKPIIFGNTRIGRGRL